MSKHPTNAQHTAMQQPATLCPNVEFLQGEQSICTSHFTCHAFPTQQQVLFLFINGSQEMHESNQACHIPILSFQSAPPVHLPKHEQCACHIPPKKYARYIHDGAHLSLGIVPNYSKITARHFALNVSTYLTV